jgi:hypothetical protein
MNADISSVQIAERLADPMRYSFADVPNLSPVPGAHSDGKTQFKWHIEAGHPRRSCVKFDAREIVDRIGTLLDEFQYSLKPTLAGWDFQCCAGYEPKRAQSCNIGQIQALKRAVVADVQKYGEVRNTAQPFFALFRAYLNVRRCPLARARLRGLRSDSIR